MSSTDRIAVLLTCHNRKDKTLACLEALFDTVIEPQIKLDVYLVDDGSTDGTWEAVSTAFPSVNLIKGNGNLFWNQGMRLAWDYAVKTGKYDFYLWLNDDTILFDFAIQELLECYGDGLQKDKQASIIVGACKTNLKDDRFSYGGMTQDNSPVIPNGELQSCYYINGNATLVPQTIYEKLGNLSADYTHAIGDSDYGLRAINSGFRCYTSKKYIATCPTHEVAFDWCNPDKSLRQRWESLHSPRGINIKEYNTFRKKFWGWKWRIYAAKVYLQTLSPKWYKRLTRGEAF